MKKLISLFLILCMTVSLFTFAAPSNATYGYLLGDANDDGAVSLKDVLLIRKYVAGVIEEKEIGLLASDTDIDGDVTLKDILKLRKYVAGVADLEGNNVDGRYKVDTITIADKNISRYTIVLPEDADECMVYSASELVKFVKMACGIALSTTKDASSVRGYKIEYKADAENLYDLGKEGYRMAVEENGDMSFTCGTERGALYATYYFLEEFVGWRFLFDDVDYLYEAENVNVDANFEEIDVPVLEYRTPSQSGITSYNFAKLRSNGADGAVYANPYNKYGGALGTLWEHAHSYAAFMYPFGSQVPAFEWLTQPCLTSEETFEGCIDYSTKLLENRMAPQSEGGWGRQLGIDFTHISVSPNDNTDFCDCSSCKKIYEIEGSIAGTVFRFSNRVCEELLPKYPGLQVYTVAYWDARNPPKYTRPSDDITVTFCIGGCNNHTYDDVEACVENGGNPRLQSPSGANSSNEEDMRFLKGWAELTNNLWIWYYSANFCYHAAPAPNLFNIYNDFKYLASLGVSGIYNEGSGTGKYSFEYLRGYMSAKMMWDPFMSEEEYNALFNEYLMIYYGDGWEYLREYIEMSDYASDLQGCWTNNFDRPWNMYNKDYFTEHYEEMHQLFVNAYEAAKEPAQKTRVERTSLHCEWLGLSATYERDYVNGSDESKAEYAARYKHMWEKYNEYNMAIGPYGSDYPHGCNNYPTSASDIRDPMTWVFEDFSGYWEWSGDHWV